MTPAEGCGIIANENDLQARDSVLNENGSQSRRIRAGRVYICNCNGIRERQARAAIEAGATRPADIFRHCQAKPCCAKCVCDMRQMIQETEEVLALAAE